MKVLSTFVFIIFSVQFSCAQHDFITQKTANLNHFNPALIGTQSNLAGYLSYKGQLISKPGARTRKSFLFTATLKNNLGMGFELMGHNLESSDFSSFKLNLNHNIHLKNVELRYGGSFGYNGYNLLGKTQIILYGSRPINGFTTDLGAAAYFKGLFLSASAMQFTNPSYAIGSSAVINRGPRFVGSIGYQKELKKIQMAMLGTIHQQ